MNGDTKQRCDRTNEQDEVEFLDSAIKKMEGLLRVGYGEAGTTIIGKNLVGIASGAKVILTHPCIFYIKNL
jgi:hypothetical protein